MEKDDFVLEKLWTHTRLDLPLSSPSVFSVLFCKYITVITKFVGGFGSQWLVVGFIVLKQNPREREEKK